MKHSVKLRIAFYSWLLGAFALLGCFVLMLTLSGCQVPQWRIFQAEVPKKIEKQSVQIEAEREAAKLVAATITEPDEMVTVAAALSESLGEPEKPINPKKLDTARDKALAALLKGMQNQQKQLERLNAKLEKYEGKAIEGTGFNLFGLTPIAAIALAFLCPSVVIPILIFMGKRTKAALISTVEGIQSFKKENPEVAVALTTALKGAHDKAHGAIVKKIKSKL
jgi:hypothetical protein